MTDLERRIAQIRAELARHGTFPQQRRALERELSIAIADLAATTSDGEAQS